MKDERLFEYDELLAMGMLIAARTAAFIVFEKHKDQKEGRMAIEQIVTETIAIRWDAPGKEKK